MTVKIQIREPAAAPNLPVAATDRATGFEAKNGVYTVQFDWQSVGCPASVCVALGDQTVRVPLPNGFPDEALAYESQKLVVYEREQAFKLSSEPGRTSRNAALTLQAGAIDVPFTLFCQEDPLLDGNQWGSEWSLGAPLFGDDGEVIVWIFGRVLRGLEKEIVERAACRPEGRWHSVLVQRNEYPSRKVRTEYLDGGDVVIVVEHYRQQVSYVWHNYRCVNGNWAKQDVVFDQTTREFTLRFEAI